jgi:hypothetical protein
MVFLVGADHHGELERIKWQCLDCTFRRGPWSNYASGISAGEHQRAVLRKRSSSDERFFLDDATVDCVSLPENPKKLSGGGEMKVFQAAMTMGWPSLFAFISFHGYQPLSDRNGFEVVGSRPDILQR